MTTPSGIIWEPITGARTMIANSSNFQTLVGAATVAEALEAVFAFKADYPGLDFWAELSFPEEGYRWERDAGGVGVAAFRSSKPVRFRFLQRFADGHNEDNSITFGNNVGLIIADLFTLAGQGGNPRWVELVLERPEPETRDYEWFHSLDTGQTDRGYAFYFTARQAE